MPGTAVVMRSANAWSGLFVADPYRHVWDRCRSIVRGSARGLVEGGVAECSCKQMRQSVETKVRAAQKQNNAFRGIKAMVWNRF